MEPRRQRRRPVGKTTVPQGVPQSASPTATNGQHQPFAPAAPPQPAGGPTVLVAGAPPPVAPAISTHEELPGPAYNSTAAPAQAPPGPFPPEALAQTITVVVVASENYARHFNEMMKRLPVGLPVMLCWAGQAVPRINRQGLQLVQPARGGQTERGFEKAYALNCGIRRVQTPYTFIMDADMLLPDGFWTYVLARLHPATVMRFFVRYLSLAATKRVFAGEPFEALPEDKSTGKAAEKIADTPNPCIYATAALHQLRGYDEHYFHNWGGEDDDLTRRGAKFLNLKDMRVPLVVTHLNHNDIKHPAKYRQAKRPRLGKPEQRDHVNPNGWGDGN